MAHIINNADINMGSPSGTWGTDDSPVSYASAQTAASGGTQLFKDRISPPFKATSGSNVVVRAREFKFTIPNGEMPDAQTILMIERWLAGAGLTGSNIYVALHTGDPGDAAENEVSGNGYVRKAVTYGASGVLQVTAGVP